MITEDEQIAYIGHIVYLDTGKNNRFVKKPFTVLWKFIMSMESSINTFEEEKFTCFIVTVSGASYHIVGNYKELNEQFLNAIKHDRF